MPYLPLAPKRPSKLSGSASISGTPSGKNGVDMSTPLHPMATPLVGLTLECFLGKTQEKHPGASYPRYQTCPLHQGTSHGGTLSQTLYLKHFAAARGLLHVLSTHDTTRYIYVRSKTDGGQLNLAHGIKNEK